MSEREGHPLDFGPLLDRRIGEPGQAELEAHLEGCAECRREFENWRSVENLFRAPELDLPLPAFQWSRIQSRIEAEWQPYPWHVRLGAWLRPLTAPLGVAFSALFFMALTYAGFGYRSYTERQLLAQMREYALSEQAQLRGLENPFRKMTVDEKIGSNPFTPYQEDDGNPFNIR